MNSTELTVTNKDGLTANALKYIAIAAMLIDHIAWCFVDTYSVLGQIMHVIGRLTAPIMCYFIAEGYHYTRNVKKYLLRLGIFAIISWAPFVFMELGLLPIGVRDGRFEIYPYQGVIYTFFLGLLALVVIHSENLNKPAKVLLLIPIFALSVIGDWLFFAIIYIIIFDRYRGDFKKQMIWFAVTTVLMELFFLLIGMTLADSLFQMGVLLAIVPLYFYNGRRGGSEKFRAFNKWFFYVFYPLHMVILGVLKFYVLQ